MGKRTKLPKLPMYHELVPGVGGILGGVLGGLGQAIGDTQQQALLQQQIAQQGLQQQLAQASHPVITQADLQTLVFGGRPPERTAREILQDGGPLDRRKARRTAGAPLSIAELEAVTERWFTDCTDGRTLDEYLAGVPAPVIERRRWWHDVPLERFGHAVGAVVQCFDFEILGALATIAALVYLFLQLL